MMYINNKDEEPVITVNNICQILSDLKISVKENWTDNIVPYSLKLEVFGLSDFSVSGKGITKEYAKASAYAELMERLQNGALLPFERSAKDNSFYYAPDEVLVSKSEFIKNKEFYNNSFMQKFIFRLQKLNITKSKNNRQIIDSILSKIINEQSENISLLPFINVKNNEINHLPVPFVKLVGSNGMCAGNTPEEALVQGICEILERYSYYEILYKNLVPPIIPTDEYYNNEEIKSILKYYESLGYEIQVRDCSLGKGFPVVAVLLIDRDNHLYSLRFGSHPYMATAIQRCLTEFAQTVNLENKKQLSYRFNSFPVKDLEAKDYKLYTGMTFLYGVSTVGTTFFTENENWKYDRSIWCFEQKGNKKLCKELLELCSYYSKDIYIRDFSFLGFYSYHIIVPSMSYVILEFLFDSGMYTQLLNNKESLFNIFTNKKRTENLYVSIKNYTTSKVLRDNTFILNLPCAIFALIIAVALKKYADIPYFINIIKANNMLSENIEYSLIECLNAYAELRNNGYSDIKSKQLLYNFYNKNDCDIVFNWVGYEYIDLLINEIDKIIPRKNLQKQHTDIEQQKILKNKIIEAVIRLRERYKNNIPNQNRLVDIVKQLA